MKRFRLSCILVLIASVAGCSSSNAPNTPASTDYLPLTTGTWWRYQTQTGIVKRTVTGTAQQIGYSYAVISDSATGATTYIRKADSQYFRLYFSTKGEPLAESMILDEKPGALWSEDLHIEVTRIQDSYTVSTVHGSRTVLSRSYPNVLLVYRSAVTTASGSSDTTASDEYVAKGIGEIELRVNGVSAESLMDYHIQPQ